MPLVTQLGSLDAVIALSGFIDGLKVEPIHEVHSFPYTLDLDWFARKHSFLIQSKLNFVRIANHWVICLFLSKNHLSIKVYKLVYVILKDIVL